ncbi:HlyD family type I secretion periplasmic adaptor subunit [Bosea beijingensis]|uniref:HlyD family type I secretion periplasmic adaptor subunit n=1 Tax=Bosea beijingensis TaxID=3068632 RepID=UPI002740BB11|nr:HlyD family type I secretion periplasmic adaptor subunit [Bosea sp. REN20]
MTATTIAPSEFDRSLSKLRLIGATSVLAFFGIVGTWACTTGISGAVIASGQFVVEGNTKKIQHPTGGVVAALLVKEGDHVQENQIVIRLDGTLARVGLHVVTRQLDELFARRQRLIAEADEQSTVSHAPEFADRTKEAGIASLFTAEQKLFTARRTARDGQRAQLEQRIIQFENEIEGLQAQLTSRDEQIVLVAQELVAARELYTKNLVSLARKIALEREAVNIAGQKGQIIAALAQSRGKIAEIRLQIFQIEDSFREEVLKDLRETQAKIAELTERRIAAEDQLKRVDIRASTAGVVHQLAVHTVGGVISPAEPAMLIVPDNEPLQIEARVTPADIDQVRPGGAAQIKLHAFNQRITPELTGTVSHVSADTSRDQINGPSFYIVRIVVPPSQLDKFGGQRLSPGMTADVFITTENRTPLEFIAKPLKEQFNKAFRER